MKPAKGVKRGGESADFDKGNSEQAGGLARKIALMANAQSAMMR